MTKIVHWAAKMLKRPFMLDNSSFCQVSDSASVPEMHAKTSSKFVALNGESFEKLINSRHGYERDFNERLITALAVHNLSHSNDVFLGDAFMSSNPTDRRGSFSLTLCEVISSCFDGSRIQITTKNRNQWATNHDNCFAVSHCRHSLPDVEPPFECAKRARNKSKISMSARLTYFCIYVLPVTRYFTTKKLRMKPLDDVNLSVGAIWFGATNGKAINLREPTSFCSAAARCC